MQITSQHANQISQPLREKITRENRPPDKPAPATATIIPFPVSRRIYFIQNILLSCWQGDHLMHAKDLHKRLNGVVRDHKRRLQKLGVAPDKIEADVCDLEHAFGLVSTLKVAGRHSPR